MKKYVYFVTAGSYDDYHVVGAFSSRAKAIAFCNHSQLRKLHRKNPGSELRDERGATIVRPGDGKSQFVEFSVSRIRLDVLSQTQWSVGFQTLISTAEFGGGAETTIFISREKPQERKGEFCGSCWAGVSYKSMETALGYAKAAKQRRRNGGK